MSLDNLILTNIISLKKNEFDEVVRLYISEVFKFKRIVNTDGKDDSGNDIRVFDIKGIKNQYQLTVQKSNFKSKLNDDLDKANKNHIQNGFSNSLFFFYSKPLTNKAKDKYVKEALLDFGIILVLIEAKQISQEAAFTYRNISALIFELNKVNINNNEEVIFGKEDKKYKMLYDLLSFGSTVDIKGDLIKSYILHLLLENNELPKLEVYERIDKYFKTKGVKSNYDNIINKLSTSNKIIIIDNRIKLSKDEINRLKKVIEEFELTENLFVTSIEKILLKNGINGKTKEVINRLKKVYDANYDINLNEIDSRESNTTSFEKTARNFKKYIQKINNTNDVNKLVEDLFSICDSNDFIQKVSAGNFFSKVTKPENMQRFANIYNSGLAKIYLDTQILLRAICVSYNPKLKFKSPFLWAIKNLIDYCNKNNLALHTSKDYAHEVSSHFKNALNLIPYTKIKKYRSLGKSKNVFFQFYEFLYDNNHIDKKISYEKYLHLLGFNYNNLSKNLDRKVNYLLSLSKINIIDFPKTYSINETKRFFNTSEGNGLNRKKKVQAITFDAKMVEFLADEDVDVNPIDPIFITWDKTFFKVRKEYFKENRHCTKWFMFTPSKFVGNHSLLNFEVEAESLTNEILSILDKDSDFILQTQSLLDSINSIINYDDEVGIEYINKLSDLRDKEINRVDDKPTFPITTSETEQIDERPIIIDLIFFRLTNHFNKEKELFENYKTLFTNKKYLDDFIEIITDEIEYYNTNNKLNPGLIRRIKALIERSLIND